MNSQINIDKLLPDYLSKAEKNRLLKALSQFEKKLNFHTIYKNFYLRKPNEDFSQGDIIPSVRYSEWNMDTGLYEKLYMPAMIISNTCDIDQSNKRDVSKEILFAPCTLLNEYTSLLPDNERLTVIEKIKKQLYSNILFLPSPKNNNEGEGYVVRLDQLFTFPLSEFLEYSNELKKNRIASLNTVAFYIFIVKLSYHFCRLPEERHR